MKSEFSKTPRNLKNQTTEKYLLYRKAFAILCIISFLGVSAMSYYDYKTSGNHNAIRSIKYNELIQSALEIRLDQSRSLFQFSLVFLGGIWGLIIARKKEAILAFGDKPELIMSIVSLCLIVISLFCHITYVQLMMGAYLDAGIVAGKKPDGAVLKIADVFVSGRDYLFLAQVKFTSAGMFTTALTYVSAHKLK